MPDDLRTRIAKVLHRQFGPSLGAHPDGWDREPRGTQDQYLADADAVIRELELHREDMNEWAVLANGFRGHRYVTHWEENEPAPVVRIRSAEKLGLTGDGE